MVDPFCSAREAKRAINSFCDLPMTGFRQACMRGVLPLRSLWFISLYGRRCSRLALLPVAAARVNAVLPSKSKKDYLKGVVNASNWYSLFMLLHSEKQIIVLAYLKTIQGLQSCYIWKQNGYFSIYKDFHKQAHSSDFQNKWK